MEGRSGRAPEWASLQPSRVERCWWRLGIDEWMLFSFVELVVELNPVGFELDEGAFSELSAEQISSILWRPLDGGDDEGPDRYRCSMATSDGFNLQGKISWYWYFLEILRMLNGLAIAAWWRLDVHRDGNISSSHFQFLRLVYKERGVFGEIWIVMNWQTFGDGILLI